MAATVLYDVPVVSLFLVILLFLLASPAGVWACSSCFSSSPFHLGLILGTFLLIPLPGLIAWALFKAAKNAEKEANSNVD